MLLKYTIKYPKESFLLFAVVWKKEGRVDINRSYIQLWIIFIIYKWKYCSESEYFIFCSTLCFQMSWRWKSQIFEEFGPWGSEVVLGDFLVSLLWCPHWKCLVSAHRGREASVTCSRSFYTDHTTVKVLVRLSTSQVPLIKLDYTETMSQKLCLYK